ncbi:MAG: hypothetical protein ACRDD7_04510 [Peptostreptococcaceae bacterium]
MKKYYIKPIIIFSSMIIMVFTLNHLSKDKLKIETIEGNLSDIGDVSLVYTPSVPDLKKEEIVISKDGIENYTKKEYVIGRDFIEVDRKHNDFVKFIPSKNIFEDENYIGKLEIISKEPETYNTSYYDIERDIVISLKNKKIEKIKTYTIPIKKQDIENIYSQGVFHMSLYNEKIYVVGADNESVYIANIDLNNKSYKLVNRIEEFKYNIRDLIVFKYKNKIYIEVDTKDSDFLIYDINQNKLIENKYYEDNKTKYTKSKEQIVLDITIEENILNVICKNKNNELLRYQYKIHDNGVKLEKSDIYDNKIDFDYIYNEYNSYYENEEGIKSIQVVDDKVYTLHQRVKYTTAKTKDGAVPNIQGNKPIEFSVFDMNKNELVYKANLITSERWIENKFHFVK